MWRIDISFVSVLIATIATMTLGAIWYSRSIFGRAWLKLVGKKESSLKGEGLARDMIINFFSTMIMAYILGVFIKTLGRTTPIGGAIVGFWIWFGFVFLVSLNGAFFSGRPKTLLAINMGYQILNFMLMGLILGAFM